MKRTPKEFFEGKTPLVDVSTVPTSACTCPACVSMCERRPCWGTPAEMDAIAAAGFGDRLMEDYWVADGGDVAMLAPAIVGYEGREAPYWPNGRCTFLTTGGRCELHSPGLKPLEGRHASCASRASDIVRKEIVRLWYHKTGGTAQ